MLQTYTHACYDLHTLKQNVNKTQTQTQTASDTNMTNESTTLSNEIINELTAMRDDGATRTQAIGYLAYKRVASKLHARYIMHVFGDSDTRAKADHATAIAVLIAGKRSEKTNKQIIADLCEALDWQASTAATLLSYYSYMLEYERQTRV